MIKIKATVNQKDVTKTIKKLGKLRKSAIPQAVRMTVNDTAFLGRSEMQKEIESKFTLRNKFVKSRVKVNKARQRNIKDMEAETGHTERFMKIQEEGGQIQAKQRKKPIPTKFARIGKNQGKLVRRALRLSNIGNLTNNSKYTIVKPRGKKTGIYQIMRNNKLRMLYDLSQRSVKIKSRSWMQPAVNRVKNRQVINRLFLSNAKKIINKVK